MSTPQTRWKILGQILLGLFLTFLFFYTMAPFMIALVIGAIIAILCRPGFNRLKTWMPRALAGLTMTIAVTLCILAPLGFVGVMVAVRLSEMLRTIKLPSAGDLQAISSHPIVVKTIQKIPKWIPVNREWLQEQSLSVLQAIMEAVSKALGGFLAELPGLLLAFTVVIIAVYFFIVDGHRFARFLKTLSPLTDDKSIELYDAFSNSCRGVVLGMLVSSLVQGLLILIFFLATGIPNAILWTSIALILGLVPVIGVAPVVVGGILYHFFEGQTGAAIVMIVGSVIIGTSDNVVRPWVLKGHGEMHPLLGLVSAFGAVSVLGPTGIILGPIIAAVFVAFLQILSADLKPQLHGEGGVPLL